MRPSCLQRTKRLKEKDAVQTDSSSEKGKGNPITGSKSVSQNMALSLIMILLLPRMCFFIFFLWGPRCVRVLIFSFDLQIASYFIA